MLLFYICTETESLKRSLTECSVYCRNIMGRNISFHNVPMSLTIHARHNPVR